MTPIANRTGASLGAYLALTRPSMTLLLVFVCAASMVVAAGGLPRFETLAFTILGGASMLAALFAGKSWEEASGDRAGIPEGGDPLAALDGAAAAAKEAVAQPGAMEREVQFARGPMPGAGFATLMFTDILIHAWDLAKATGQDATLPPDLVDASYAIVLPRKGQMPQPAFAPEVEVGEDADTQTRLLGMLGRDAGWVG